MEVVYGHQFQQYSKQTCPIKHRDSLWTTVPCSNFRRRLVLLNMEIVYGPQFQQYSQKTCPNKHGGSTCRWVGAVVRSLPPNPEVPGKIPVLVVDWIIWVTFFPVKVHSAFHPSGVGKMSTSIHGRALKRLPEAPIYASGPLGLNRSL